MGRRANVDLPKAVGPFTATHWLLPGSTPGVGRRGPFTVPKHQERPRECGEGGSGAITAL